MALRTTTTTARCSRQWKGILWMSSRQQSNWSGLAGNGGDGSAQSGSPSASGSPQQWGASTGPPAFPASPELNPMPGGATGGVGGFSAGVPPLPPVPPTMFGPPQGQLAAPPGGFAAPQGGFAPPQDGFAPLQGGFAAPQGGFVPPQGGLATPQGGFAAPQRGFVPPQGFSAPQGGFSAPQHGFVALQGYAAPQGGFAPGNRSTFIPRYSRQTKTATPVPDKEPFGLMIFWKPYMSDSEVLDLFADQNPVSVDLIGSYSHIFFSNRADLVAALARSQTEDVNYIRLETSTYLEALGEIGDRGPFRVQVRALPQSMTSVKLSQFLCDSHSCTVLDCALETHRHNETQYAFVEVATKAEMMSLLERSGKKEMNGMTVTPALRLKK